MIKSVMVWVLELRLVEVGHKLAKVLVTPWEQVSELLRVSELSRV